MNPTMVSSIADAAQQQRDAALGRAFRDWHLVLLARADSAAISAAEHWGDIAGAPSFGELHRRRGDTAERTDGPDPLDALFPRPRSFTEAEQRRASRMLDAAFGVDHTHGCSWCGCTRGHDQFKEPAA